MSKSIDINRFLQLSRQDSHIIVDVRSEGEYEEGHFPGALSLPLLNNSERHIVGIEYKQHGQAQAVKRGFELVGHQFHEKLALAKTMAGDKEILLYCWRGGMRSEIMQWVFSLGGIKVNFLEGGYKALRRKNIELFSKKYSFVRLSGPTATCKTEILDILRQKGECVVDLEKIANHRGSAFGGLGKPKQVTQEQFENLLSQVLYSLPNECSVWIENESRFIGTHRIPDLFFNQILQSDYVELKRDFHSRVSKIVAEYSPFDKNNLIEKTVSVSKRMGPEVNKVAVEALHSNDFEKWATLMLNYYDKTYTHSDTKNNQAKKIAVLDLGASTNFLSIAEELLLLKEQWMIKK